METLPFLLLTSFILIKSVQGVCYKKLEGDTTPLTIQTVAEIDSIRKCFTFCGESPGCFGVVYTETTKTCVTLNTTEVVPTGSCAFPFTWYGRFSTSCPGPANPEDGIMPDPCVSQVFPESTIFGTNRICPKRSCTDPSPFVVRAILKNGSKRTFDNEEGNSVVWNPSTQLFDFTYTVSGSVVLQLEVQSIVCATPVMDSSCSCTVPLNLNTAAPYSSITASSVDSEPTCPAGYPLLKTTNAKTTSETTDTPTDVIIRCMASKWIACRKSTLASWMVNDAACIQP